MSDHPRWDSPGNHTCQDCGRFICCCPPAPKPKTLTEVVEEHVAEMVALRAELEALKAELAPYRAMSELLEAQLERARQAA